MDGFGQIYLEKLNKVSNNDFYNWYYLCCCT